MNRLLPVITIEKCDGCGKCVSVCPESILVITMEKASIKDGCSECIYCGDCESACTRGAIRCPFFIVVNK